VDLIQIAKKLNEKVEMSEHEFRVMMKYVFDGVPSYHMNQIVRAVKQNSKPGKMELLF